MIGAVGIIGNAQRFQVVGCQLRLMCQGMPRANEHFSFIGIEGNYFAPHASCLLTDLQAHAHQCDRNVGTSAFQVGNDIHVRHVAYKDIDFRMQFLEGQHDAACQMKRQQGLRAYGQRSSGLHAFSPGLYALCKFQNGPCVAVGEASQRGKTYAAVAAF